MARIGHLKIEGRELPQEVADAPAYLLPRVLSKHGLWSQSASPPCKTRKLSEEEIRQRREYVATVREARRKKQAPPRPPWEKFDPELERIIREVRAARARTTPPAFEEME